MEIKICTKCKEEKEVCEFNIDKTKIDGHYSSCKECKKSYFKTRVNEQKTYLKKWRTKNPNYIKEFKEKNPDYVKNYYNNNKNKMIDSVKKHYNKNKETILPKIKESSLKYYYENIEIIKEKHKKYRKDNRTKINQYVFKKKLNDPIYRLSHNVRGRIYTFLKNINITKQNKTFDIVGCSPKVLKEHLETQFIDGMNWNNHGQYGWHIDHIIPLSSAKTEEEIYKLCHYTNLQPLWAEDNLKKSDKILS
jgi:hypothetical protein